MTRVCSLAGDVPDDCTLHAATLVNRPGVDKHAGYGFRCILQRWTMHSISRSDRASWYRLRVRLVRFRWVPSAIVIDKRASTATHIRRIAQYGRILMTQFFLFFLSFNISHVNDLCLSRGTENTNCDSRDEDSSDLEIYKRLFQSYESFLETSARCLI